MIMWKNIIPGPDPPRVIYAIIEIPKFSMKKYEISKNTNMLLLDRVLHSSVVYPQDYGFIPGTFASDGDPLDVLVLVTTPTVPLTLVKTSPIGVLLMEDEAGVDEKILSVAIDDPFFNAFEHITEVPKHFLDEIEEFFRTYKNLELGKAEVKGWDTKDVAYKIIVESIERFKEKFGDIATIAPK